MNFFPFHIGDYLVHTRHLSLMEDLAYRRTLDLYYTRDGSIPAAAADVARLIGMREQEAEVATVLAEFFPDGRNKRADEELAKMHAKQDNARASVAKRTQHASVTQASREHHAPTQTNTNNQEPRTIEEKEPTVLPAPSLRAVPVAPPAFDGSNLKAIPAKAVVPLAPNFDLPEEWGVDAEALGFPRSKVLFESERFRQFWAKGKGAQRRKSLRGWRQAWSNWLGKAAERAA